MICPDCKGSKKRLVASGTGQVVDYGECPTCKGTGVVPEPPPPPKPEPPKPVAPPPPAPAAPTATAPPTPPVKTP